MTTQDAGKHLTTCGIRNHDYSKHVGGILRAYDWADTGIGSKLKALRQLTLPGDMSM